jgi:hypothetical protein
VTRRVIGMLLVVFVSAPAAAQTVGPYLTGHVGLSGGDGGAALGGGGAVGYMTPRRLGFELEINVSPGLDFGDLGLLRNFPSSPLPTRFPEPTIDATGRLLTFQTNVVAALASSGRLRVLVSGGGGVANLRRNVVSRIPTLVLPPDFTFPDFDFLDPNTDLSGFVFPDLEYEIVERRSSGSENALCLNAGGTVEYAMTPGVAVGVDARYTHGYFNRDGLHGARVVARARWHF